MLYLLLLSSWLQSNHYWLLNTMQPGRLSLEKFKKVQLFEVFWIR